MGGTLREATMRGLTGPTRKLSSFRGKPLIINVWASWCGPCRAEMGSLQQLSQRAGAQGFQLIGISTDDYEDKAQAFLKSARTSFPHFIDRELELENMLGADRLPLTLLVDARGKVLGKYYGAADWNSAQALALVAKAFGISLS